MKPCILEQWRHVQVALLVASLQLAAACAHSEHRTNELGIVVARLLVGVDGKVKDVQIQQSGGRRLDNLVRGWAINWRYHPAMAAGKPVESWRVERVRFRAD